MAFHIRDDRTDRVVRQLATRRKLSITETVRLAAENELNRDSVDDEAFMARIRDIQRQAAAYPKTGLKADKAFYDELSGDI
ncbi:type II toxin-antitoxin system VapB family antitoxin [Bosea sp. PAMC 26642]|uniref:type II toxin-antitoxin system VapB family antitoxin n=1 Tax=Bosea sp. (strain PAMC 26642) TaxID=1792307 RepID=UPI0007703E7E|nr:type II toxin-antitoxin system VapB family antitoxin [Bosea sp. PAMC 26642]AMJ63071.1 transcription factor [Bosea sp. PAMC 26642]